MINILHKLYSIVCANYSVGTGYGYGISAV